MADIQERQLRANKRLMHRSILYFYSITSPARASNDGSTSRPFPDSESMAWEFFTDDFLKACRLRNAVAGGAHRHRGARLELLPYHSLRVAKAMAFEQFYRPLSLKLH
jgi:hypothetical protein